MCPNPVPTFRVGADGSLFQFGNQLGGLAVKAVQKFTEDFVLLVVERLDTAGFKVVVPIGNTVSVDAKHLHQRTNVEAVTTESVSSRPAK